MLELHVWVRRNILQKEMIACLGHRVQMISTRRLAMAPRVVLCLHSAREPPQVFPPKTPSTRQRVCTIATLLVPGFGVLLLVRIYNTHNAAPTLAPQSMIPRWPWPCNFAQCMRRVLVNRIAKCCKRPSARAARAILSLLSPSSPTVKVQSVPL